MSWRDRVRQPSIDGFEFYSDSSGGSGGRRIAIHEFPLRDEHSDEDLGLKSSAPQRLSAFLIGPDFDLLKAEFEQVLNKPGIRKLVHHQFGVLQIRILSYSWSVSTAQKGFCRFDINFIRAGEQKYPQDLHSSSNGLATACNNADKAIANQFKNRFNVDGTPEFVKDDALSQLDRAVDTVRKASAKVNDVADRARVLNGQVRATLQPVNELSAAIDRLGDELADIVKTPLSVASAFTNVIGDTIGALHDIDDALATYDDMGTAFFVAPVVALTSTRAVQAANQLAISELLQGQSTIELSRWVATTADPFNTYQQAISVRDNLLGQIDDLALAADDDSYQALRDLQTSLIQRVDEVAPGLAKIDSVTLAQPLPALAASHFIYGDASRADELVSRNAVSNPNFVPAGINLEVLREGVS